MSNPSRNRSLAVLSGRCAWVLALLILTSCGTGRLAGIASNSATGGVTRPSQNVGQGDADTYETRRRLLLAETSALSAAERRIALAKTPADKLAALNDYRRVQEEEGRYAWGRDPVREPVTWTQALAWWPYDPVLRAMPSQGSPETEHVFVGSPNGGRHGDPRKDLTTLVVVYDRAPKSVENASYNEIIDSGGVFIQVVYLPPAIAAQKAGASAVGQPVTVRGHAATLSERARPRDNVDWRDIAWAEPVDGGGVLAWTVSNSTARYSRQQSLRFVDQLISVRGTG